MAKESKKQEVVTLSQAQAKALDERIVKLNNEFVKKGFSLCAPIYNMNATKAYTLLGYDNIYDYASDRIDRSRGAVSEYITMAKRFFKLGDNGQMTNSLLPEYKEFSYTQLLRMKSLSDSEIAAIGIDPSWNTTDIKNVVDEYNSNKRKEEAIAKEAEKRINAEKEAIVKGAPEGKLSEETKLRVQQLNSEEHLDEIKSDIAMENAYAADMENLRKQLYKEICSRVDEYISEIPDSELEEYINRGVALTLELNPEPEDLGTDGNA